MRYKKLKDIMLENGYKIINENDNSIQFIAINYHEDIVYEITKIKDSTHLATYKFYNDNEILINGFNDKLQLAKYLNEKIDKFIGNKTLNELENII